MEKAIEIVENKIQEIETYINVPGFKERYLILNDVLRELKSAKKE